ncbi:MAG: amidase [Armatimonadetes bacterium]|nr:amidase [Armatimonadota bacterium]
MDAFELKEATINDLQQRMVAGEWSAASLTERYLERIDALDRQGPALHAVIEVNPDALSLAQALDEERETQGLRGPLHGIPVLIKDNIDTADRMTTTAGSLALEGSHPGRDSFVARRLRQCGAVILGKTNMSEWANFRSQRSSSGWSGRGGQCRNPYALDRTPSGSSSGTGAAVAANLAVVGVGTETSGSIVSPASACSLVGIKPTHGLISRSGIIPLSRSLDTAGPMARTVRDAALLLGALSGFDPDDDASRPGRGQSPAEYTALLDADGLRGARLGVLRSHFGSHPWVERLIEGRIEQMRSLGAVIIDPVEISHEEAGVYDVILSEFKECLNAYLDGLGPAAPVHSLKAVIEFNERSAAKEMPFFGQELLLAAEQAGLPTEAAYGDAQARRHKAPGVLEETFDQHALDAVVAPTGNPPWLIDWVNGDSPSGWPSVSGLAAISGWPHITVPAGSLVGLPIGLSFIGRAYSEPELLRLAYAFEQATRCRRAPEFRPTAVFSEVPGGRP